MTSQSDLGKAFSFTDFDSRHIKLFSNDLPVAIGVGGLKAVPDWRWNFRLARCVAMVGIKGLEKKCSGRWTFRCIGQITASNEFC